jgi:hypothetical protein
MTTQKNKLKIRASKWDRERKTKLYTCGVHFQHEMAEAMGPQVFYNSLDDLKEEMNCWKSDGIVEIDVSFSRWIHPQNLLEEFSPDRKTSKPDKKVEKLRIARGKLWFKYMSDLKKLHSKNKKL